MKRNTVSSSNQAGKIPTRGIVTFEPCGPIASMLQNALRRKPRGARTKLIETAIANLLGPKYPKVLQRYNMLLEEAAK